jgi:hypothetical protein
MRANLTAELEERGMGSAPTLQTATMEVETGGDGAGARAELTPTQALVLGCMAAICGISPRSPPPPHESPQLFCSS